MLKYSVIIPTYNRAYCVGEAVESVIISAKTSRMESKVEIIIVDDGSTDEIEKKVNELKQEYAKNQIVFLPLEENGGVARARNKGIELARGEWVLLLDSDDRMLKDAFCVFEEYTKKYPEVVNFAFGGTSSRAECTVHCKNGEFLGKDVCDWFDKSKFDGEFQKLF